MNEREFLKKIRRLQESGQKIGLTDIPVGHNSNNGLLNEHSNKKFLKEEDYIQTIDAEEQREEENKFKDIVSKLVKFRPIKVHKENVEWSGHLIREKIDWHFSLDDTVGCYIDTTDLIQLTDDTLEVLKKLRGYYDVWSDDWSSRLVGSPTDEEGEEEVGFDTETGDEGGFGDEEGGF
jgi:hypothetical protein